MNLLGLDSIQKPWDRPLRSRAKGDRSQEPLGRGVLLYQEQTDSNPEPRRR